MASIISKVCDSCEKSKKVSDARYNQDFQTIREVLGDSQIVDEMAQYMSSDDLEEFTEHLARYYEIEL